MKLSEESINELKAITKSVVAGAGDAPGLPGATIVVVDKHGTELFAHSTGKRGIASPEALTLDGIFSIASCTKMVTALACMQLVEKGELALDDGAQAEELCPELKDVKVLKRDGSGLEEKNKSITLRMLLTHTAGFGYSFFNERLRDHLLPVGMDELNLTMKDLVRSPLLFQPGEGWEYGVSIDWAGLILERRTGKKLNDYMQENIFSPLGLQNINMIPTQSMKDRLVYMHSRQADGTLIPRDHFIRSSLLASTPEEVDKVFNAGGAGLYADARDYARILSVLLNDGTDAQTGHKLVDKSTMDEMFRNQIPQFPDFGRQGLAAAKPDLVNAAADIYPAPGSPPQGWGLSFMLTSGATGRTEDTTAMWAGLANLYWWCDREQGVAGIVCTQVLPFGDPIVGGLWFGIETAVYKALRAQRG